ncbi:MAG: hypothetical protein LM632_01820 [Armatimonadetes bacterium]|nr:hypothetical protein [Armatimonadota bacterium]
MRRWEGRAPARPKIGRSAVRRERNLSEFCQSCDAKLMRQQVMRGE